jgi:hypothetical protein
LPRYELRKQHPADRAVIFSRPPIPIGYQ